LASFTIERRSPLSATLTLPRTLGTAERGALPALVLGTLAGAQGEDVGRIAVALNGRIAGISKTWTQNGEPGWFGVLAPESLVESGTNDLRLFEVSGSALRPIPVVR
jgi:hypothetical protein